MYDLKQKFGDIFRLDIVGQRGSWSGYGNFEYYQNCMDLIEDLQLSDVVTVYDKIPHEQIPGFLAREHAIISNSNEEGTHVSIAEGAMTGCIPFVNCWRGVEEVYPAEVAEHFHSPGEFVALCTGLKMRSEAGSIAKASKALASAARKRYGDLGKYDSMVAYLEEAVNQRAVPKGSGK
jgi:glycosyltransferase involved in cell wall biosynthesis